MASSSSASTVISNPSIVDLVERRVAEFKDAVITLIASASFLETLKSSVVEVQAGRFTSKNDFKALLCRCLDRSIPASIVLNEKIKAVVLEGIKEVLAEHLFKARVNSAYTSISVALERTSSRINTEMLAQHYEGMIRERLLRTVSDIVSFDNLMAYAIAGAVLLSGGLMAMAVPGLLTPTAPLVLAAALVGTASAGAAAAYLYTPASVTAEVLAKSIEFASKPDVVQAISDGFRTSLFAIVDDFVSAAPSPLFLDTQLIWLDESHSSSNSDRAAAFAALRPLYSKPVLAATADEIRAWLVSNPDVGVVIIASGMHMAEQILPVLEQRALGGGGLAVKHAQVIDFFVVSADAAADTLAKAHPGIITCVHSSPSKAVDQVLHPPAKPIECLLPTFKWEARLATASTLSLDPAVQAAARGIDVGAAVDEFMKLRRGMAPPLPASYAFELSSRMRSLFSQDRSSTLVGAEEIIRFCTAEQEAPYCYPLFHKVVNVPFRTARKGVSGLKMAFLAERLETAMRLVYSARPDARPRPHVEGTRDLTLYHAFPVASDAQFNAFATAASGTLLYFRESMKVSTSRETAERSVPVDAMYRVLLCLACPEERLTSSAEGGSSPILLHALDSSAGVDDVLLEGLSLCTVSTAETSGERTVVISATLRQSVNASPFELRAILL